MRVKTNKIKLCYISSYLLVYVFIPNVNSHLLWVVGQCTVFESILISLFWNFLTMEIYSGKCFKKSLLTKAHEMKNTVKLECFCTLSLILCDPIDCSLSDFFVHGIFQARILEWVDLPSSREIFLTQGLNLSLLHCRQTLHRWATREAPWILLVDLYSKFGASSCHR